MKEAIFALALLWALSLGWVLGDLNRSGDYQRGYDAGFTAPREYPEQKVVGNMLCSYAKLACGPVIK